MERISGYFGVCHHFRCGLLLQAVTPNVGLRQFASSDMDCMCPVIPSTTFPYVFPFFSIVFLRSSFISTLTLLLFRWSIYSLPLHRPPKQAIASRSNRFITITRMARIQLGRRTYKQRIDLFCETVFAVSDLFTDLQIAMCPLICRE